MTMLDERLRTLGGALDVEVDDGLADAVLARLDESSTTSGGRRAIRIAAAVVLVLALVAVAVPSSRRTVADWFGFDGVRIERRADVTAPSRPDPLGPASRAGEGLSTEAPAPIGTIVVVGGVDVLVSEFVGTLENPAIGKTIGDGTSARQVEVGDELGVWIDGAPHDVSFLDAEGDIVFERFAGNTLLWQDGPVIRRLEGFPDVAAAVEYAEQLGT